MSWTAEKSGGRDDGSDQTQITEDGRGGDGHGRSAARVCRAGWSRKGNRVHLRKRPRSHPLSADRVRLPSVAHRRRRFELDDLRPDGPLQLDRGVQGRYRCIASDLRNAYSGQSSGPLEIDRPWDAYTDDHLGLMDHLGIEKFMVMGFCIYDPAVFASALDEPTGLVVTQILAELRTPTRSATRLPASWRTAASRSSPPSTRELSRCWSRPSTALWRIR